MYKHINVVYTYIHTYIHNLNVSIIPGRRCLYDVMYFVGKWVNLWNPLYYSDSTSFPHLRNFCMTVVTVRFLFCPPPPVNWWQLLGVMELTSNECPGHTGCIRYLPCRYWSRRFIVVTNAYYSVFYFSHIYLLEPKFTLFQMLSHIFFFVYFRWPFHILWAVLSMFVRMWNDERFLKVY